MSTHKKLIATIAIATLLFSAYSIISVLFLKWQANEKLEQRTEYHYNLMERELSHFEKTITRVISQMRSTATLISNNRDFVQFIESGNPSDRQRVEEQWRQLANFQSIYSQVRFINTTYKEVIRINYDSVLDVATKVDQEHLQYKKNTTYIDISENLAPSEVAFYGFDPEFENDRPVYPLKHAMRVITPIYSNNVIRGYVVLNVDTTALRDELVDSRLENRKFNVEVIEPNGNYVSSHDNSKLFVKRLNRPAPTNADIESDVMWQEVIAHRMFEHSTDTSLNTYRRVLINVTSATPTHFYLKASVDKNDIAALPSTFSSLFTQLFSGLSGLWTVPICLMLAWMLIGYREITYIRKLNYSAMQTMSAIGLLDADFCFKEINSAFIALTGYTEKSVIGKSLISIFGKRVDRLTTLAIAKELEGNGQWKGEFAMPTAGEKTIPVHLEIHSVLNASNQIQGWVVSFIDITAQKNLELELHAQSHIDSLTQLPNRRAYVKELTSQLDQSKRYQNSTFTMVQIDLDHFKLVNDKFGHDKGDKVLEHFSQFLRKEKRESDFVARIGGEEFILLLPQADEDKSRQFIERLFKALHDDDTKPVDYTFSAGLKQHDSISDIDKFFRQVDKRLYTAKKRGRNQVCCDDFVPLTLASVSKI